MNIFPETLGLGQIISRELKEEIERRYNTYVELEQRLAEARVEVEHLRQQTEWLRLSAKALTIQPDDSALKTWLGEPAAWKHDSPTRHDAITSSVKELLQKANSGYLIRPLDKTEHYTIPLYAPKGLSHGN